MVKLESALTKLLDLKQDVFYTNLGPEAHTNLSKIWQTYGKL